MKGTPECNVCEEHDTTCHFAERTQQINCQTNANLSLGDHSHRLRHHFWHTPLRVRSAKGRYQLISRVDDSEPYQLLRLETLLDFRYC